MDSFDSLETWAAYELWTLREAAYLMSGLPPRSEVEFKADMHGDGPVAKAYRALKDATIANSLAFIDVDGVLMRRRVRPSAAVAWAVKREMPVPAALMSARGAVSVLAPAATEPVPEKPKERRARLLAWLEAESRDAGERGALERVTARERAQRPTADRSNVGKEIKKARAERAEATRAGPFAGLGA